MPKTAKKRAQVKSLPGKKKLSSKDMKKVKGGLNSVNTISGKQNDVQMGLLLPAVQKVRE